jgi:hypothetical protein
MAHGRSSASILVNYFKPFVLFDPDCTCIISLRLKFVQCQWSGDTFSQNLAYEYLCAENQQQQLLSYLTE